MFTHVVIRTVHDNLQPLDISRVIVQYIKLIMSISTQEIETDLDSGGALELGSRKTCGII